MLRNVLVILFGGLIIFICCERAVTLRYNYDRCVKLEEKSCKVLLDNYRNHIVKTKIVGFKIVARKFRLWDLSFHSTCSPIYEYSDLPIPITFHDVIQWEEYIKNKKIKRTKK